MPDSQFEAQPSCSRSCAASCVRAGRELWTNILQLQQLTSLYTHVYLEEDWELLAAALKQLPAFRSLTAHLGEWGNRLGAEIEQMGLVAPWLTAVVVDGRTWNETNPQRMMQLFATLATMPHLSEFHLCNSFASATALPGSTSRVWQPCCAALRICAS